MIWANRSQGDRERAGKEMGQGTSLSSSEPQGQGVLEGPPGQRPALGQGSHQPTWAQASFPHVEAACGGHSVNNANPPKKVPTRARGCARHSQALWLVHLVRTLLSEAGITVPGVHTKELWLGDFPRSLLPGLNGMAGPGSHVGCEASCLLSLIFLAALGGCSNHQHSNT